MVTCIWVNIGFGNGLLPNSTKPLPEAMLTHHRHWHSSQGNFIRSLSCQSLYIKLAWNYLCKTSYKSLTGQWVKGLRQWKILLVLYSYKTIYMHFYKVIMCNAAALVVPFCLDSCHEASVLNSLRPDDAHMCHEKWLPFPEWRIYASKLLYFALSARESPVKQLSASMS